MSIGITSAESHPTASRPTLRFMLSSPWHCLALGFGTGLAKVAPGTWATAFAWPLYRLLELWLDTIGLLVAIVVAAVLGAIAAGRTGRDLGEADSRHIVIDEIVAFWCVLFLLPDGGTAQWTWVLLAFLVFRFFDIAKPPPIRYLDARYKNGFGVMLDDLVAAFFSAFAIALGVRLWP